MTMSHQYPSALHHKPSMSPSSAQDMASISSSQYYPSMSLHSWMVPSMTSEDVACGSASQAVPNQAVSSSDVRPPRKTLYKAPPLYNKVPIFSQLPLRSVTNEDYAPSEAESPLRDLQNSFLHSNATSFQNGHSCCVVRYFSVHTSNAVSNTVGSLSWLHFPQSMQYDD